jgi:hypothetical protein
MRKQFQPNAAVPMGTDSYKRLALELRMSGETLIARPSVEAYNTLSKMLAALSRAGMEGAAVDLATDTMNEVCDRYTRVGKIGVSPGEAEHLRLAIASIDDRLPQLAVNRLRRAVAEVEIFCATVGA